MPEKFKSFFSKIITNKRLKIVLFSFIVLSSIFIPLKDVNAIWGIGDIGLFDLSQTQLDALDFVDSVILRLVIFIALLIIESEAFIFVTANLLQWAMKLPINLGIGATKNLLVASGWQFTLGLTNLFFILAFVVIALAHILGLDTFEMKKSLPKLIIIALLVNFSLVFIGIFVDIVNIFQTAILDALGENLVTLAIQPLVASAKSVAAWFILIPTTYLITALIPFGNVVAAVAVGSTILTDIISGGVLLKGLFLIVINFLVGTIFLFYFVFFLMRIAMIWILAIFAPLAFFSYILPQTQGVWKEWLKTLSEWLTLGIVIIFLTGLGLKLFAITGDNAILEWGENINTGRGSLPAFIYNYLFLIVYMGIAAYYSIKYTPQMANTLLDYGKGFAGSVKKVATTRTMKRDVWGPTAEIMAGGLGGLGKRLTGRAERELGTAGTGGKLFWGAVKGAGKGIKKPASSLIEYSAQQRKIATPKGWDQMTIDDKTNFISSLTQDGEKLVLASKMKGEKTYQKSTDAYFKKEILAIRDNFANDPRYAKEVGDLMDAEPDKVTFALKLNSESVGLTGTKRAKKRKETMEKVNEIIIEHIKPGVPALTRNEAAGILHAQGLSSKDMAELNKGSMKSLPVQLALRKMSSSQLRALQNNFDEGTVHATLDEGRGLNTINQNEFKDIMRTNPRLVRWAFESPGGREMLNWSSKFRQFRRQAIGGPAPGGPPVAPPPGGPPVAPPPTAPPKIPTKKSPNYLKAKKRLDYIILERRKLNRSIDKVRKEKAKAEESAIPATKEWKEVERLEKELGKLMNIKEIQINREIKYLRGVIKKETSPSLSLPSTKEAIKNSSNFDELFKAISDSKGIQGSKRVYSSEELEEVIRDVVAGKKGLRYITRAQDLRKTVRKLMELEKKKKS